MRLGRIDEQTTANVGTIEGGSAINVIPERCRVVGEVRSLDEAHAASFTTEMIDHLQDAADAQECDLDLTVEQMSTAIGSSRARRRWSWRSERCALAASTRKRSPRVARRTSTR